MEGVKYFTSPQDLATHVDYDAKQRNERPQLFLQDKRKKYYTVNQDTGNILIYDEWVGDYKNSEIPNVRRTHDLRRYPEGFSFIYHSVYFLVLNIITVFTVFAMPL